MLYSRQQNPNDNRCHGKPTASLNFIRENGSSVPGIGSTSAPPLKTTLQLSGESVNSAIICGQKRASFCIPASLNASYVHSSSTSIAMLVPDIDFPLDHRLAVTLLFYIIKCNMACHSLCHVRTGNATILHCDQGTVCSIQFISTTGNSYRQQNKEETDKNRKDLLVGAIILRCYC